MKKLPIILVLVLILTVYGLVSSVLGDLLVGDVQEWLGENYKGKEKQIRWGVAIITFVLAASVTVYFFLKGKNPKEGKESTVSLNVDNSFLEARKGQRKAFKERSDKKLAGRDFIDLEVSYTVEGSNDLAPLLNAGVKEGETEQDLFKVFEGADGRLLIIGLPGSGKTTLLLQLAIALLNKYEEQIPVVLDIATWQPRFTTIEEWAVELLPDMGFNKTLATQLIDEKKLLPLFDGLDELNEDGRSDFLTALEKYAAGKENKFVITSRKAEYAATIDAAVEYQVVVNPFTLVQIRKALQEKFSPERASILEAIDADEHFREAIKTPFYLNAVQLLFSHKNLSQKLVFEADNLVGRQGEIEKAFVEHALGGFDVYAEEDAKRWLAFLADRMSRRGLVRFELANMQYDWIKVEKLGHIYAGILDGLVTALAFGLIGGISFSLFLGLIFFFIIDLVIELVFFMVVSLVAPLALSLVLGTAFGLISFASGLNLIRLKDNVKWSVKSFVFYLKKGLAQALPISLVVGCLLYYLFDGLKIEELAVSLIGSYIVFTILVALLVGLIVGLTKALSDMLLLGQYTKFLKIDHPYQRFNGSMRSFYFSILQHWHLCYLLRKKGLIVKRYPDFLKAATEQSILESDGGSWRFRHRILQEYFVGVWEKEYGDDPALADNWKTDE